MERTKYSLLFILILETIERRLPLLLFLLLPALDGSDRNYGELATVFEIGVDPELCPSGLLLARDRHACRRTSERIRQTWGCQAS